MALLTPRAFLGLDLGAQAIKVVELVDRGRRLELSTYAYAPCPPHLPLPELATAVSRVLGRAQVSSDVAIVAVPTRDVFSTHLSLPNASPEQLSRVIRFKASELIPAALTDVTLAWRVRRQPQSNGIDVYLTAVSKKREAHYRELASRLQLELAALEPEAIALARANDSAARGPALIIDLHPHTASWHVLHGGFALASSVIEWDADDPASSSRLAASLARVPAPRPEKTILTGSIPITQQLTGALRRVLLHEPHVSYPWYGLAYPQELESTLVELGPLLAQACGLARRPFTSSV